MGGMAALSVLIGTLWHFAAARKPLGSLTPAREAEEPRLRRCIPLSPGSNRSSST
uniref:hypothetical protein n=1 Tax=Serratia proteamaculans TaxID=28151 RepID=UPI001F4C42D2|nr:hypothetical protein [Serratia proteamaculans]